MSRLIRFIVIFAIITAYIMLRYDFETELMWFIILTFWFAISFFDELVSNFIMQRKLDDRHKYIEHIEHKARTFEEEVRKLEDNIIDAEETISNQVLELDNANKRIKILTQQDKTTIKIGDLVTPVKYHRPNKVWAMKQSDKGIVYQLTKSGKWYNRNEIRKVEIAA